MESDQPNIVYSPQYNQIASNHPDTVVDCRVFTQQGSQFTGNIHF